MALMRARRAVSEAQEAFDRHPSKSNQDRVKAAQNLLREIERRYAPPSDLREPPGDDLGGNGAGVREPRRPRPPGSASEIAVDPEAEPDL